VRHRNPLGILGLLIITLGIYGIYWLVSTKNEMKKLGADIPTAWLLIVPFVNLWWYWKYCQGVEKITGGKFNGILALILFLLIGGLTAIIVQSSFNEVTDAAPANTEPIVESAAAAPTFTTPAPTAAPAPETSTPTAPPVPEQPTQTPPTAPPQNTPPTNLVQ
jgi:hypothetical protein